MIRKSLVLLFASSAIFTAVGSQTAVAGETAIAHVPCPVPEVTRVVSVLPYGWKATPLKGALASIQVEAAGGKATLICEYGVAGSLTRASPTGFSCAAVTGGFDCKLNGPPSPPLKVHQRF